MTKWKRWWCVISNNQMAFFPKEKSKAPKDVWSLAGSVMRRVDDHPNQFRIGVTVNGDEGLLRVESGAERMEWMTAMGAEGAVGEGDEDEGGDLGELPLATGNEVTPYLPPACALGMAGQCMGWLHRSAYNKRSWKRRFCVLMDAMLYTFKKETDAKPESVLALSHWVVLNSEEVECGKKAGFKLSKDGTRHLFYASAQDEAAEWMASLREATKLSMPRALTSITEHMQAAFDYTGNLDVCTDAELPRNSRKYKRRFFVLVGGCLLMYKSLKDVESSSTIFLREYTVELDLEAECGFRLLSVDNPDVYFQAPSQDEQSLWLSVLHQAATGTAVSVPLTTAEKSLLLSQRIMAESQNTSFFEEGTTMIQLTLVANCKHAATNAELEAAVAAFHQQLSFPKEAAVDYYLAIDKPQLIHPSIRASIKERSDIDIAGAKPSQLIASARSRGATLGAKDLKRLRARGRTPTESGGVEDGEAEAEAEKEGGVSGAEMDALPLPPPVLAGNEEMVLPSPPSPSVLAAAAASDAQQL